MTFTELIFKLNAAKLNTRLQHGVIQKIQQKRLVVCEKGTAA